VCIWYPCYIPKFTFLLYLIILQENFIFPLSLLSYILKIDFDIHLLNFWGVLHCLYDLITQFYIVLCCLIFILHDNFMLKDNFIYFCMWQLKGDYMQGHIWKGYSMEWSPRIVIKKNILKLFPLTNFYVPLSLELFLKCFWLFYIN
jgi:hypothetical protein